MHSFNRSYKSLTRSVISFSALVGIISGLLLSCAYRFTNQYVNLPPGIRSIAVEAVYDTSREVLPHELLWESLQRAIAQDGHLRLVSQGKADAILRAHLSSATIGPTGDPTASGPDKDPDTSNGFKGVPPNEMRVLNQAGSFTQKDALGFTVSVEVINLYTKAVVFQKSYFRRANLMTARGEGAGQPALNNTVQRKTQFLFYEEALRSTFARLSDDIAAYVVRDFLIYNQ